MRSTVEGKRIDDSVAYEIQQLKAKYGQLEVTVFDKDDDLPEEVTVIEVYRKTSLIADLFKAIKGQKPDTLVFQKVIVRKQQ